MDLEKKEGLSSKCIQEILEKLKKDSNTLIEIRNLLYQDFSHYFLEKFHENWGVTPYPPNPIPRVLQCFTIESKPQLLLGFWDEVSVESISNREEVNLESEEWKEIEKITSMFLSLPIEKHLFVY